MMNKKPKTLAAVGCGPRAAAIAVNSQVLRDACVMDVDFKAYERRSIGANWSGLAGYTDGRFSLDTSPLKDLTFPRTGYGSGIDRYSTRFSFIEFFKTQGDSLERWVSAGMPSIPHRVFAQYQEWALAQTDVVVESANVECLHIVGDRVEVTANTKDGRTLMQMVDGVVLTGPGEPVRMQQQDDDPERVFNAETYWINLDIIRNMPNAHFAVVGSGQSAGIIARSALTVNPSARVDMVNRLGFIPAQSAGLHENLMCSMAGQDWTSTPYSQRVEIMRRINSGVVDATTKAYLDLQPNLNTVRGDVLGVCSSHDRVRLALAGGATREYDIVVVAAGFDPVKSLLRLMPEAAEMNWFPQFAAERAVDYHLRIPGLPCNIHMPALAGLSQGPGLALLSCLATMSNRVLSAYGSPSEFYNHDHYTGEELWDLQSH